MRITRFLHGISHVVGKLVVLSIAVACAGGGSDSPGSQDYGIESDRQSSGDSSEGHDRRFRKS